MSQLSLVLIFYRRYNNCAMHKLATGEKSIANAASIEGPQSVASRSYSVENEPPGNSAVQIDEWTTVFKSKLSYFFVRFIRSLRR